MNHNRIGIIVWDIGQIGGIVTQALDFKRIFDGLGVNSEIMIVNDKKKIPIKFDLTHIEAHDNIFKIKGIELSCDYKHLNNTLRYLNDNFNILLYTTTCVHNENSGWLEIYRLRKRNLVIISDVYWDKFYPYYDKAVNLVERFYATNGAVKNYIKKQKSIECLELIQPFFFNSNFKKEKRLRTVIWANQWRSWKGIRTFMANASKIESDILLFGSGREYFNLKNNIPFNAKYLGFQAPECVIESYKVGSIAVDMTGQSPKYYGHYNRTTIEPMFYKCAVVCNEKLVEPYSFIPKNMVLPVTKDTMVEGINSLLDNKDKLQELTDKSFNWATGFYKPENVVKQFNL